MGFLSDIAGSLIGGAVGLFGADRAADAQGDAARRSAEESRRQFDLIRQDTAPGRQLYGQAINELSRLFGYQTYQPPQQQQPFNLSGIGNIPFLGGNLSGSIQNILAQRQPPQQPQQPTGLSVFQASPDYNFRRSEGMRGIEQTAAARGGAFSGNALRTLSDFNSNLAAGEYGDFINRRLAMAGLGQVANQQSGVAGLNTAANVGNALMAGGNARASGILGATNTIGNTVGRIFDAWNYYNPPGGGPRY